MCAVLVNDFTLPVHRLVLLSSSLFPASGLWFPGRDFCLIFPSLWSTLCSAPLIKSPTSHLSLSDFRDSTVSFQSSARKARDDEKEEEDDGQRESDGDGDDKMRRWAIGGSGPPLVRRRVSGVSFTRILVRDKECMASRNTTAQKTLDEDRDPDLHHQQNE